MYVNLKRSTARRRYTPRYTHSGGASGRSRGEALSGSVPLAGTSPKMPEGGVLDCGVDSEIGGGLLLVLRESLGPFPWSTVQRSASWRLLGCVPDTWA